MVQPKRSRPAPSGAPRPELLPAAMRGEAAQAKAAQAKPVSKPTGSAAPRPELLPAKMVRGGVGQAKPAARPAGSSPPRPDLLPAKLRGGVGQAKAEESEDDDTKVRAPVSALYRAVYDYDRRMAFIAHWIWWEGSTCKVLAIGSEEDAAGLESRSENHPDQTFWDQKNLEARPNRNAAIVTDCKLLPCVKSQYRGCAHALPGIIASKFGAGIPIACFGHAEALGERQVFYTVSGATRQEIDQALSNVYTWEWDDDYDPSTY